MLHNKVSIIDVFEQGNDNMDGGQALFATGFFTPYRFAPSPLIINRK